MQIQFSQHRLLKTVVSPWMVLSLPWKSFDCVRVGIFLGSLFSPPCLSFCYYSTAPYYPALIYSLWWGLTSRHVRPHTLFFFFKLFCLFGAPWDSVWILRCDLLLLLKLMLVSFSWIAQFMGLLGRTGPACCCWAAGSFSLGFLRTVLLSTPWPCLLAQVRSSVSRRTPVHRCTQAWN